MIASNVPNFRQIVDDYCAGVMSGEIVAGKLVRGAVKRHLDDLEHAHKRGWKFDADKASRACSFFPLCLKHSIGEWSDAPFELAPWQAFITWCLYGWVDAQAGLRRFRKTLISIARKNGKGLALDTRLPTPTGWTTMGDVRVGDELIDDNGLPCAVTFVSDVHNMPCYRVEFSNGQSVVCDEEHLWTTTARIVAPGKHRDGVRRPKTAVRNIREIASTVRAGSRRDTNHSIDMPAAMQLAPSMLPIDPYVLGAWLGDGSSDGTNITCGDEDVVELSECLAKCGIDSTSTRYKTSWRIQMAATDRGLFGQVRRGWQDHDGLKPTMRRLGLIGNKHIPLAYLRASFSQRLSLLQGLMDTDGTCDKEGRTLEFSSTKVSLVVGVCELLSTLGVKYGVAAKQQRCNGRLLDSVSYRVTFTAFKDELPCFRLKRKLDRMRNASDCKTAARCKTVQIVSVTPIDSVPTKCIQVNSPSSLFLCGETMIPTHNTTWAAGMELKQLYWDEPEEPGAQVYCVATKEDQAKLLYREAERMVGKSIFLSGQTKIRKSPASITFTRNDSTLKALGSDSSGTDGLNPHCVVMDELHAWRERHRELKEKLSTGGGARRQPLEIIITTAGNSDSLLWIEEDEYARNVIEFANRGQVFDDRYFSYVATIDEQDDPLDEAVWPKANPNLGVSVKLDYLREKARTAANAPELLNQFIRYFVNAKTEASERAITDEMWQRGAKPTTFQPGDDCHGGIDLGRSGDFAAVALCFPRWGKDEEGDPLVTSWEWLVRAWTCSHGSFDVQREPFASWIRDGLLRCSRGNTIDFAEIEEECGRLAETYNVLSIAYDKVFAREFAQRLQDQRGIPVFSFYQSHKFYNEPLRRFLTTELPAGRIVHGNDPVLNWMAANLQVDRNSRDEWMPDKGNPKRKIDGIVAGLMAFSECLFAAKQGGWYNEKNKLEIG